MFGPGNLRNMFTMWQEHQAVNLVISVRPIQAPSVDMYAEADVPGLFTRMEINHLSLPFNYTLSTVQRVCV